MRNKKTISVAMAAYNGERYLNEQLDSILIQLRENDEIIISLDPSSDNTESIIKEYCRKDSRVKLCHGPGQGVVRNFENAIKHCRNEIIFLSDQDDVWKDKKVMRVLKAFDNPRIMAVLHDAEIVDEYLKVTTKSFFQMKNCRTGIIRNIVKNSYIGCCLAFRRKSLIKVLPFPEQIPMHDQWIGILCEWFGKVEFIREPLILYRRHGDNLSDTEHASLKQMIKWRVCLLKGFIKRVFWGK